MNIKALIVYILNIFSIAAYCQIDSLIFITEQNGIKSELLLNKKGECVVIQTNNRFHRNISEPMKGSAYISNIDKGKTDTIFKIVNNDKFNEHCKISTFYKDSLIVCNEVIFATHTAISHIKLYNQGHFVKWIQQYEHIGIDDDSWRQTNELIRILHSLMLAPEKEDFDIARLPRVQIQQNELKKISLSHSKDRIAGFGNRVRLKENQDSIGYKLIKIYNTGVQFNPFKRENIKLTFDLKSLYILRIQYNNNLTKTLVIDGDYIREENRMWTELTEEVKNILNELD